MDKVNESIIEHLEHTVQMLAMERAMVMKLDVMSEEEVTKFINQVGEKYARKYARMSAVDIIFEQMMEMAKFKIKQEDNDGE